MANVNVMCVHNTKGLLIMKPSPVTHYCHEKYSDFTVILLEPAPAR